MSITKRTTVTVRITADIDVTDSGYLGWDTSVQEHVDHVIKDAESYWQVGIKKGGGEFKRVPATISVLSVKMEEK